MSFRHSFSAGEIPLDSRWLCLRSAAVSASANRGIQLLLVLCLAALAGCQNDDIHSYAAPKAATVANSAGPEAAAVRLLVAMMPHGEQTWFFKLSGPADAVSKRHDEFDKFIHSIRFTEAADKPLSWTLPESWKDVAQGESQFRYATIRIGTEEPPLDLTVTHLGREFGSLLANVNRWRGQIGLKSISEAELGSLTKEMKINDVAATLVDMTGTGAPAASAMTMKRPALPPGHPSGRPNQAPIEYTKPDGWTEIPSSAFGSVLTFRVSADSKEAQVTVTPLAGPAGGLEANVNRWREQVGLALLPEDQVAKETQTLVISGANAQYADVAGPESAGARRERILGAVVPQEGQTWFFKMRGPADLIEQQKSAFEAFLRSVHFKSGRGTN